MRAKVIIISFFILLAFVFTNQLCAQDSSLSNKKAEKEVVKQRKAKGKAARKDDKKVMKSHYKAQGKETRKRMKKNERKSKRIRKNKKPPFWESWFSQFNLEMYKIEYIG
jgi:DNA-binding transcriptional regulator YbjK